MRLGNPKPKINNLEAAEQSHWQGQSRNTENMTLDRPGDTAGSEVAAEEEQIQSEASDKSEETQGRFLEELE